ncbi:hypothetical protein [Lentzea cavernae]|uniref:ANTAR domain-containing protein n=1 Tax=Lentzea cavernae TaxID=2020703 RepID=A0ABQ3LYW5_9PSEU|nr:hypothetical protein [Lentzea cavernae]GHH28727.1 hypothetical protein GCM10017774_03390 [Lentzea cavernae]
MTVATELDDMALQHLRTIALQKLDNAVRTALSGAGEDAGHRALEEALAACAEAGAPVSAQVLGSVEAAGEHLRYGERMEARMLLTVAHRLLSGAHPPMVLPEPSTPGDVVLGR